MGLFICIFNFKWFYTLLSLEKKENRSTICHNNGSCYDSFICSLVSVRNLHNSKFFMGMGFVN